jgi:F0F1-type ATP synthase epsilon subunit
LPGAAGAFEVLKGHVPILAGLKAGEARVIADKKEHRFRIGGGFFEFARDQGVVLADSVID